MKRITVTITDEQAERLARKSQRKGVPISALVRDLLEKEDSERKASPFEAMIGIVSKQLPYSSSEIDFELEKSWADAIRSDRS